MENELLIGSHVSMNAPNYFLGSVEEAISYNENVFMFYTGAPQNSYRKPLDELKINEGIELLNKNHIDPKNLIVHAPYIINPANYLREDLHQLSIDLITNELIRTQAFGAKTLVLHPGSATGGQDRNESIRTIARVLDVCFEKANNDVCIALETMAGKGNEIGCDFIEIKAIIDNSKYPEKLKVCLDTCHISDAGYDIHDFDTVIKDFIFTLGLKKLAVIHLNDSKNPRGAHKDRHENIGYGEIGFETLSYIAHHPLLIDIPKILETPYYNEKPPYKMEIKMLKENKYIPNWRDSL